MSLVDNKGRTALYRCSEKAFLQCVNAILEAGPSNAVINTVTNDGENTALTASDDPSVVAKLIEAGGCDIRNIPSTHTKIL